MARLYKFKSNPKTFVSVKDGFTKVEWSESMYSGYDSRWMMHKANPDNLIPLTRGEVKQYKKDIKQFEENLKKFKPHR